MKNKIVIITGLSVIITFSLFTFMAFLISSDQVNIGTPTIDVPIDIVTLPDEKPAQPKPKPNLKPPTPPPPMPRVIEQPKVGKINTNYQYTPTELPKTRDTMSTLTLNNKTDGEARPIVRVNPKYPISAARDGIEGWVVLAFDISEIGEVINISVIDSKPKRIFDKAAKRALKKWKYRAKYIDGSAITQRGLNVQLEFKMGQQS